MVLWLKQSKIKIWKLSPQGHISFYKVFWMLDVSRTAFYEITLLCPLSVCLSVRLSVSVCLCSSIYLSQSFFKIGSLFFSIIHDNSWPWYLVTDDSRFLRKKNGGRTLVPLGLSQAQIEFFLSFFEFGSLVFLEITYNDSLQQCLTFSRG